MDTKKYAQLTQLHYLIDKYPDQERAGKKIKKTFNQTRIGRL